MSNSDVPMPEGGPLGGGEMAEHQIRIYAIRPGEMAEWIREWRERVVPLRRQHGFQVRVAWRGRAEDRFVWVLSYAGPVTFAEADRAYYASIERRSISPDPARHIASSEHSMVELVPTGIGPEES